MPVVDVCRATAHENRAAWRISWLLMVRALGSRPALSRPLWRRLLFGPARLRAGWRVLLFILLVMGIGALVRLAYDRLGIRLGRDWTPITFLVQEPLNLWFAIGFHFAFDFAALSLFGAPNTGNQEGPCRATCSTGPSADRTG